MTSAADFPGFKDEAYVQHLRGALWSTQGTGRAAIMVGSGFSRNATPLSSASASFPLWSHLTSAFAERLGIPFERASSLPMPKLGSLFEATFDRAALDDLLLDVIPWRQHTPGSLHTLLMSLPWADVFTTNYDTLLEDAAARIIERRYDLVLNARDIPGRSRPRIVKLHGSFPSARPFVFTEEDFRQYTVDSAAFVNLVQQSMLENTLCLVGFSGDDPNFQAWAGWARDRLGPNTPTTYLCGWLDWSDAERRYWGARNVSAIDLAPLFPRNRWPDPDERHHLALQWLLGSLATGAPPSPLRWPDNSPDYGTPNLDPRLPELLAAPSHPYWNLYSDPAAEAAGVFLAWHKTLSFYPGWEVCPWEKREHLRAVAGFTLEPHFQSVNDLDAPCDLLFASQWVRWGELTLRPIRADEREKLERISARYGMFGTTDVNSETPSSFIIPAAWSTRGRDIPLDEVDARERWLDIAFALLTFARDQQDIDSFNQWVDRLRPLVSHRPARRARLYYERCLLGLAQLAYEQVQQLLHEWPESSDLPMWETRRAAIQVGLGMTTDARRTATRALADIRIRFTSSMTDYALLSQEGWTLALLDMLSFEGSARDREHHDFAASERERRRLERLAPFLSDPWDDFRHATAAVMAIPEQDAPARSVRRAFDPGWIDQSWGRKDPAATWHRVRPGFELLRMMERGGLPLHLGYTSLHDAVRRAAKLLWPVAPLVSLSIQVQSRAIDGKLLAELLTRSVVTHLSERDIEAIFEIYAKALDGILNHIPHSRDQFQRSAGDLRAQFSFVMETLSRIAFRLPSEKQCELLNLACRSYRVPFLVYDFAARSNLTQLFERLWFALPEGERLTLLPNVLDLPVFGENAAPQGGHAEHWPDVLRGFSLPQAEGQRLEGENRLSRAIARLLFLVQAGGEATPHAARLLLVLSREHILSAEESTTFWTFLFTPDVATFIRNTSRSADFILAAPTEWRRQGYAIFKRRFLENGLPYLYEIQDGQKVLIGLSERALQRYFSVLHDVTTGFAVDGAETDSNNVPWMADEIDLLFTHFQTWASDHEARLRAVERDGLFSFDWEEAAALLLSGLLAVVLPYADDSREPALTWATELLLTLPAVSRKRAQLLPWAVKCGLLSAEEVRTMMDKAIQSVDSEQVIWGTTALHSWLWAFSEYSGSDELSDVWTRVVERIAMRHPVGLEALLHLAKSALIAIPDFYQRLCSEKALSGLAALELETRMARISMIQDDDIPALRAAASSLAAALYFRLENVGETMPDVLTGWREHAVIDVLPEVRQPWSGGKEM